MYDRRSLLTAAAGAVIVSAAPVAAFADAAPQIATMRFAMRGPQPVTTVFIGGKGPYLVLVDTGNAVGCMLKGSILEGLGLRPSSTGRIYGATGTDTLLAYEARDVVFGQTLFEKDVTFIGSDRVPGLDGILPLSIFTARPTDIDFTTGEVRIQLSGSVDRKGFRAVKSERVKQAGGGAFIVEATVEGVTARLLVDTGAATTVALDPQFVRRHGLWDKHPRYLEHHFGGVTAKLGTARMVRTPMLQIGPYRFQDPVISLEDPKMTTLSEIDGLIGIDLLRRFTLGFDAGASTLWLKPNEHLSDPFDYDHSGLTWDFKDGATVVMVVSPGSPAEVAGVKVGDRLVALDTRPKAMAFEGRLQGEPDTELDFEIERGGVRTPVKMILKDWL